MIFMKEQEGGIYYFIFSFVLPRSSTQVSYFFMMFHDTNTGVKVTPLK